MEARSTLPISQKANPDPPGMEGDIFKGKYASIEERMRACFCRGADVTSPMEYEAALHYLANRPSIRPLTIRCQ